MEKKFRKQCCKYLVLRFITMSETVLVSTIFNFLEKKVTQSFIKPLITLLSSETAVSSTTANRTLTSQLFSN